MRGRQHRDLSVPVPMGIGLEHVDGLMEHANITGTCSDSAAFN
jgi:hypothetical protein